MGRPCRQGAKSLAAADPVLPRPADADGARRARGLLHDQGPGLPLRRGPHDPGRADNPVVGDDARERPGPGTKFISARTMSRFVDSGVYMFHRNLFKVVDAAGPDPRHLQHRRGGHRQGLGLAARRHAADADAGLQVGLRRRVQAPAAALRALRGDRRSSTRTSPRSSRSRTRPTATSARRRRRSAGPGQSAVVVSSAAWGHEGGNDVTVEFVNRPGDEPAARASRSPARRSACCWPRTRRARSRAPRRRSRRRSRRGSQGLIDRAHPYRTNTGTGVVAADGGPGRADRLPRPEAHGRARGRGPARPVQDPRAADRQVPRRHTSRAC